MARKPAEQTVNREDILRAAAQVFYEKGYHRAKMEDIARIVDLTAGSLYHHFPNGKQEILLTVLNYGMDRISEQMEDILQMNISAADKLARAVQLHITSVTQNVSVGAAMVFEIRTMLHIQEVRDAYLTRRDRFERFFRLILEEGVKSGEFNAATDVKLFVRMMLGAHNWVGIWYRPAGALSGSAIAVQMTDWFLAALRIRNKD